MGQVSWPDYPDTLSKRKTGQSWRHDWVNRQFITTEEAMPQYKTFESGLDFIERNYTEDQWFLQIEAFDPHEPFYTQNEYKKLYPDDYHGKNLDWPDYGINQYGDAATKHVRYEYAALLSMCDRYLGKVLDMMDKYDLWKDTMLIVNTDHGFMLGEKEWMGKNIQPMYEELIHTPFFIYDPRNPIQGERRQQLAQTVDIVPTLAEFFQIAPPEFMDGHSLTPIIQHDTAVRDYALFGIFGGHICITDGRYVYMRSCKNQENGPLYEYTSMPCHMDRPFSLEEMTQAELCDKKEFPFMKGCGVFKIPAKTFVQPYRFGTLLFDLANDPEQKHPIHDEQVEARLCQQMKQMMLENQAPKEQFERIGLSS